VLLFSSALFLGFIHGLGADHLMAIGALSIGCASDARTTHRARTLGVAIRFAMGHALLLAAGAGAMILLGWSLPIVAERGGEMLGGALLVLLGAAGVWGLATGRLYGHTHARGGEPVPHFHVHIGRRERHPLPSAHSHVPTIIGAAFAVSSLRALTMLAPFGHRADAAALPTLLALIAVFAIGILLSMSLFGLIFARLISARAIQRVGRIAAGAIALASIALGVFWIVEA
jgi:nickel/cobalt exporter